MSLRAVRTGLVAAAVVASLGACSGRAPDGGQPSPSPTASTPARTVTARNLPTADELPDPDGGGHIRQEARNARTADQLSVCQQADLTTVGAAQVLVRSFKAKGSASDRPGTPVSDQPTSYTLAAQFADHTAAVRAAETYRGWISRCRQGSGARPGYTLTGHGFDWARVVVAAPATSEVAEITYRPAGRRGPGSVWESSGLTVVDDRLMVTVHLFWATESVYSLNVDDDESGFAHPQLGLVQAAVAALQR